MSGHPDLLAGYLPPGVDEAVGPDGRPRERSAELLAVLGDLGLAELTDRSRRLRAEQQAGGVMFRATVDGEVVDQLFPIDLVPRLVPNAEWSVIAAGVEQRTRALDAWLADAYGKQEAVAAGVVPQVLVSADFGYRREGEGITPAGAPRVTVSGLDLLHLTDGRWVVLEDNLRVPSGIGYALANRRLTVRVLPELHEARLAPADVRPGEQLRAALAGCLPPDPSPAGRIAVLTDGPDNSAWFEHNLLAREMDVPVLVPGDLLAGPDGVTALVDGEETRFDVLYRRIDENDLAVVPGRAGEPLLAGMVAAARAGRLTLANGIGNGLADNKAIYAYVPELIRFYLDQEPILDPVPTWLLADPAHRAEAMPKLAGLVVKPVHGAGGMGVTFCAGLSAGELARLRSRIEAAPEEYVAQEPMDFTTAPTLLDGRLQPRYVDLRVFTTSGDRTAALPLAFSRVALREGSRIVNSSQGGGAKDTWLVP